MNDDPEERGFDPEDYRATARFRGWPRRDRWGFPETWSKERKVRTARSGEKYLREKLRLGEGDKETQDRLLNYLDYLQFVGEE